MRKAVAALAMCVATAAALAGAAAVRAATLKATLIAQDHDPRLERTRVERAYLGHPGGPAADGV